MCVRRMSCEEQDRRTLIRSRRGPSSLLPGPASQLWGTLKDQGLQVGSSFGGGMGRRGVGGVSCSPLR